MNKIASSFLRSSVLSMLSYFVLFSCANAFAQQKDAAPSKVRFDIPNLSPSSPHPITEMDMAHIRNVSRVDIGQSDGDAISVSPDGKQIAFQLYQGDPETNRYRIGWFVAPTKPGKSPINVGDGGEVYLQRLDQGLSTGEIVALSAARWSPDGRWIAYLAKRSDQIQLWCSRVDGSKQEQLTHNDSDVRDFFWNQNGTKLFFTVNRLSRAAIRQARELEAERGYLIDDRFDFDESSYPLQPVKQKTNPWIYEFGTKRERPQTAAEEKVFQSLIDNSEPLSFSVLKTPDTDFKFSRYRAQLQIRSDVARPVLFKASKDLVAYARVIEPEDRHYFPTSIVSMVSAQNPDTAVTCDAAACKGIIRYIWWSNDGNEIYFERGTENEEIDGLFSWSPRSGLVRQVLTTKASLNECSYTDGRLICEYETPTQPDMIVSVDLRTGAITSLVDPNPEFRNIRLTDVDRLDWVSTVDNETDEAFGYLIKPRDYKPGTRYPLVVLTKYALGFLRQSGVDYPAHVFAANGFMVLVCNEPFASLERYGDEGRFQNDFQVRRHTQASLEAGIKLLEDRNLIDSDHIALTGFSDCHRSSESVFF